MSVSHCQVKKSDFFTKISCRKIDRNNLSFIHTNIRSAPCNLKRFDTYLDTLDHSFSFIGLTETWFKNDNKDLYYCGKLFKLDALELLSVEDCLQNILKRKYSITRDAKKKYGKK